MPKELYRSASAAEPRTKRDEKDDFWDVEKLLPNAHRTVRTPPRRVEGATDATEISFGGEAARESAQADTVSDVPLNLNAQGDEIVVRHMVPQHIPFGDAMAAPERRAPISAYELRDSIVHRVEIFPWESKYHYYRDFCTDAARYLSLDGEACPYVPFFSYVPQYSQLRPDQLRYYLYWRSELRRGNAIKTDDSYLYLYLYEIINTAGHELLIEEGLSALYRVFFTFGKENPRLSRLLSEWIVDYSLIFRLSVPPEIRWERDFSRLYTATLKEFYVSPMGDAANGYAALLLRFCTAYDYKKSHFYTEKNRDYFDRYLPGALSAVVAQYSEGSKLFSDTGMRDSHMVRNAFEEALASYRVRYRIEIDYASFSRSHEMRYLVSDILKYTENRLRAFLGVKSRLTVYSLSNEVKGCIDRYCDENFPERLSKSRAESEKELPAYEKLYDLPKRELDLSHAREIELSSWETTKRLTEAFSDEGPAEVAPETEEGALEMPIPAEAGETPPAETATEEDSLERIFGELYPFVAAAYREDFLFERTFCAERKTLPDVIADRVNELAADALGDVLLVSEGDGYVVLDDYKPMFTDDTNE